MILFDFRLSKVGGNENFVKRFVFIIQDLEERSSVNPDDRELLLKLGRLHARNSSWDASVRAYRRLLAHDPENTVALIEIGVALSRMGLAEEARFHPIRQDYVKKNHVGQQYRGFPIICLYEFIGMDHHQQKAQHPWQDRGQSVNGGLFEKVFVQAQAELVFYTKITNIWLLA